MDLLAVASTVFCNGLAFARLEESVAAFVAVAAAGLGVALAAAALGAGAAAVFVAAVLVAVVFVAAVFVAVVLVAAGFATALVAAAGLVDLSDFCETLSVLLAGAAVSLDAGCSGSDFFAGADSVADSVADSGADSATDSGADLIAGSAVAVVGSAGDSMPVGVSSSTTLSGL